MIAWTFLKEEDHGDLFLENNSSNIHITTTKQKWLTPTKKIRKTKISDRFQSKTRKKNVHNGIGWKFNEIHK